MRAAEPHRCCSGSGWHQAAALGKCSCVSVMLPWWPAPALPATTGTQTPTIPAYVQASPSVIQSSGEAMVHAAETFAVQAHAAKSAIATNITRSRLGAVMLLLRFEVALDWVVYKVFE